MVCEIRRVPLAPDTAHGDISTLLARGEAALHTHHLPDAATAFKHVLARAPDNIVALAGHAEALLRSGDFSKALSLAKRARQLAPDELRPVFVLAPAAICVRDAQTTTECFDRLQQLDDQPATDMVRFWTDRLLEHDRTSEALTIYKSFITAMPPDAERSMTYADMLLRIRRPDLALEHISAAIRLAPNRAPPYVQRARSLIQQGEFESAKADAHHAISLDPAFVRAYALLAEIDPSAIEEAGRKELQRAIDNETVPLTQRGAAGLALGVALEARADYDAAFAAFTAGNAHLRQHESQSGGPYDHAATQARVAAEKALFAPSVLARTPTAPERGAGLIFLTGMPRSGTTLVDQILSTHSRIDSVGENPRSEHLRGDFDKRQSDSGNDVGAIIDRHAAAWENAYRESLAQTDQSKDYVVDKQLTTFWNVGFLSQLFPAAKFVLLRRNPVDVCLSMYCRSFRGHFAVSNDLEALGRYYRCFEDISRYWEETLPNRIISIAYQDVIENFDATMSRVFAHCGLEFEPGVRDFHKNTRRVFTMSASQVRKPLNSSGLDRWRRYERHLQPLINALGDLAPG